MEDLIVEASSVQDPIERNEANVTDAKKKTYHKPELTKHQPLAEITLGIHCSSTVPPCVSPQDPMA
jgi:hypothetical protein